jgi:predicted secreted protein
MPASEAMLGYGSIFAIEDDNSPAAYVDLAEVFNITPPNAQVDDVDVTHNTSPNRTREFIPGLIDPGECSFEMNFIPGSTSDDRIRELKEAGTQKNCRITFPNAATWIFLASIKGYEISSATEDKMTATVTMRVSGDITATP